MALPSETTATSSQAMPPQGPPANYSGLYNGVMYINGQPQSLPTTPPSQMNPTPTPGSSVGPNQWQGADGVVDYPYQPASTQNQIENGATGFEVSPQQQAEIDKAIADTAARNAQLQNPSSAGGTAPGTGDGGNVAPPATQPNFPGAPTLPPPPPQPPSPQDQTGYTPNTPPSRSQVFGGGDQGNSDQSFASLVPRVAGNSVNSPNDISGARPNIPAWAQGLMRSPYARFLARSGQSSFSAMPGFGGQDVPVDDVEARRLQEMAGVPAWAQPGTPSA